MHEKPPFHVIDESTVYMQKLHEDQYWTKNPLFEKNQYRLNRTVAIMPWLGNEVGVGNSHIGNRISYLKSCFWSLYPTIPHIAVGVKSVQDYTYLV